MSPIFIFSKAPHTRKGWGCLLSCPSVGCLASVCFGLILSRNSVRVKPSSLPGWQETTSGAGLDWTAAMTSSRQSGYGYGPALLLVETLLTPHHFTSAYGNTNNGDNDPSKSCKNSVCAELIGTVEKQNSLTTNAGRVRARPLSSERESERERVCVRERKSVRQKGRERDREWEREKDPSFVDMWRERERKTEKVK